MPYTEMFNPTIQQATSTKMNTLNTWQHVAATLSGAIYTLYHDGVQVGQLTTASAPTNVTRSLCYIGKDNWGTSTLAYMYIDDLMFFSRGLTQSEVQTLLNLYTPNDYNRIAASLTNQWTFNSNLYDSITSVSAISPVNAAFTADRLGSSNAAIFLNYGYVSPPTGFMFGGDFSVTAWIYVVSFTNTRRIVDFNTPTDTADNIMLFMQRLTTESPAFGIYNDGAYTIIVGNPIPASTWTHIAGTLSDTSAVLYVNGVQVGTHSTFLKARSANRTLNYIGANQGTASCVTGYADDIMLFSYALTASDMLTVMNAYIPNDFARISQSLGNQWTFNQNLQDEITTSSLTQPTNIKFTSDRVSAVNSAAYLNSGYMTAPSATYFTATFTYSIWVNVVAIPSSYYDGLFVFNFGDGSGNVNSWFGYPGQFAVSAYNGGQSCGTGLVGPTIAAGTWNHVVVSLTSAKVLTLYVNAVQAGTVTCAYSLNTVTRAYSMIGRSSSSNKMWSGRRQVFIYRTKTTLQNKKYKQQHNQQLFFFANFFYSTEGVLYPGINAIIDDFMIFTRTLTIDEITTTMKAYTPNDFVRISSDITNLWTFNQNLVDSQTGSPMTNPINAAFVNDRVDASNSAVYLNLGYLTLPTGVYFNSDFSITAWVNVQSLSSHGERLFDCGTSTDVKNNIIVAIQKNLLQTPYFQIFNAGASNTLLTTNTIPLSTWTHYAVTLSGTTGTIYLNGVSQTSGTMQVPLSVSRARCYVGKSNYGSQDGLATSYYDDIMFFSRALTLDEIVTVMYVYTPNDFNRLSLALTSQWTFNQRFVEEVTGSYLTSPVNVRFVDDRLSAANSALYVNYGYVKAPSAVYFNRSLLTF